MATVAPGRLTKVNARVMPLKEVALWLAEQQGIGECARPLCGLGEQAFDVIVYETFIPRPIDGGMDWIRGNPLLTSQLIGAIRLIGWLSGARLVKQGPLVKKPAFRQIASGMPYSSTLKRRIASSTEQHDKDALAHLWRYFVEHWKGAT